MSNEIADVLDDAADYIEKHGWVQGAAFDDYLHRTPAACAYGALSQVAADGQGRVLYAAQRDLEVFVGTRWIGEWNDDPARTKQEVLDAFRAAAKQQRRLADAEVPS
jgi:hypothetical protein